MFGKRGVGDGPATAPVTPATAAPPSAARVQAATARPAPTPVAPSSATRPAAPAPRPAAPSASAPTRPPAREPEPSDQPEYRSEAYYRVKSTIFNALIETIDLTQLAQLDPESARDEIRDIVAEIISIKN